MNDKSELLELEREQDRNEDRERHLMCLCEYRGFLIRTQSIGSKADNDQWLAEVDSQINQLRCELK